jgi:hypothetical protein
MNDTTIERLLFQAPRPAAPADLLNLLRAEIALPSPRPAAREVRPAGNRLRRWFPALAFSVLMLSCAVMIAVQGNWTAKLKRQNESLRATAANLPQLREQHAALEKLQTQQDELLRLRNDNEDLHKLQAEVAQLRDLPAQIQQLRSENERLAKSMNAPAAANNGQNFFDDAQLQADRIACVNNLKQIGLGAFVWSGDNNDKFPTSLVVMSNELNTVKILICPSDKARQNYGSLTWNQFQDSMSSYQYFAQPDDKADPQCVIAKCPIHHNYLLADGSVHQIDPDKYVEVIKDGRMYLQKIGSSHIATRIDIIEDARQSSSQQTNSAP